MTAWTSWIRSAVVTAERALRRRLERFVDATMAEHVEEYRLAGAAVADVHGGEVVLWQGYGYAHAAARASNTG